MRGEIVGEGLIGVQGLLASPMGALWALGAKPSEGLPPIQMTWRLSMPCPTRAALKASNTWETLPIVATNGGRVLTLGYKMKTA